jgi:antitoxin VapB
MKRIVVPIRIVNPTVVAKIERLAAATGQSRTVAVERAVDAMLATQAASEPAGAWQRMDAILSQLDGLPDREDAIDPLAWDENGLPR